MSRALPMIAVIIGVLPVAAYAASSSISPAGPVATVPALPLVLVLVLSLVTALALVRRDQSARREAALEAARATFMQVASHELRTPLTVLRGYLAMVADGSLGRLPEEMVEVLQTLNANANEMSELLDLMLQAAQIDLPAVELRSRTLDLRERARLGVVAAQSRCERGQRLLLETGGSRVPVHVEPDRVQVVIANLIDNALRHARDGGEVRCDVRRRGAFARLEVATETLGDAPEPPRIFFSPLGPPIKVEDAGIVGWGMGLYFARELVRMHGGDLKVATTGGRLSSFVVTLPLAGPAWRRLPRRLLSVPVPGRTAAAG